MLGLLHRHRTSSIACDAGASGARLCQVRANGASRTICEALSLNVSIRNDGPAGFPTIDTARVARTVANGDFSGRELCLVLSPPLVRFTPLHMPPAVLNQSQSRIESAIKLEVSRGQREPGEDTEVRWWRLPRAVGQQPNIMAVSLPTEAAMACHTQLASVGLQLKRVDVAPCALARAARVLSASPETDVCGILDLGAKQTTLTMVVEGTPVYVRELPLTGPKWTNAIADSLHISPEMAETVKRRAGITGGSASPHEAEGELTDERLPSVLFSVLRQPLEALVQEIVDCFSYVFRSNHDMHSGRLWLAGGGAKLPGLCDYLEVTCGMSVRPLARSAVSGENAKIDTRCEFDAESAACFGAALLDAEGT
ncbi:MAG: pilus assembly protein PilM [Phycisphaerales bacterium]|nr:pilus assembly protein PilM [Phycisphaerales bacterium]